MLVALAVACSAPPRAEPPAVPRKPPRDLAVAEPPPKPEPREEIDPTQPIWLERRTMHTQPRELALAERDLWSSCVRDWVQAHPEHARRALTKMIAVLSATCDADRRIVIPPRKALVTFDGQIDRLALHVRWCAAFDALAFEYDGKRWASGPLATDERDGCTIATLPNTRSTRALLRDVVDAEQAMIRFAHDDVVIPGEVRETLRLVLDALDALSAP